MRLLRDREVPKETFLLTAGEGSSDISICCPAGIALGSALPSSDIAAHTRARNTYETCNTMWFE